MKKIYPILTLLALYILTGCSEESISNLTGQYEMDRYNFTKVENQTTEKLSKGIKALHITLADESGNQLALTVASLEWTLQQGIYTLAQAATADKQYTATLQGNTGSATATIESGDLEVTRIDNTYFIVGLLETNGGKTIKCNYKGSITFEEGEDDPEPSGYTTSVYTSPVASYDEMGNPTLHPGVTKYTLIINDPKGIQAAQLDLINNSDTPIAELPGTYTIQGSAITPGLIDSGWAYPDWGMAGGSYYVDSKGTNQYLTGGTIIISVVQGIDGDLLYSYSGAGLQTITATGETGTGAINIRFSTITSSY
ncbi:hypothetical protein [Dysgonomonas sp. 521]|uniref:hypothetical protein n=1 Tax=Dysgonomonas sp. 521 TaxID=2302932 RepID=UPI0013D8C073|nr:hypothetical protein [Dysgonomonas sp. 521]